MSQMTPDGIESRAARAAAGQAVQQAQAGRAAVAAAGASLRELLELNIALHSRTLAEMAELRRQLADAKARLKRLATPPR